MKEKSIRHICKKIISAMLVFAVLLAYTAFESKVVYAAEAEGNNPNYLSGSKAAQGPFQYETIKDGISISGYTGNAEIVEIPGQIDGQPVTSIGYGAFIDCKTLTQVIIPEGVSAIASNAFDGCSNLMKVTIPSTITYSSER